MTVPQKQSRRQSADASLPGGTAEAGGADEPGSVDESGVFAEPGSVDESGVLADEFAALSYEQARDALLEVVRRLESGAETLEESLALWERGEALARHCEQWLVGAQAKLDAAVRPSS